jgi:hypothetical protein
MATTRAPTALASWTATPHTAPVAALTSTALPVRTLPMSCVWAIGDVTGIRLLTHVGKYQGEVVAANILGEPREANYEAVPDVC